MIARYDLPVLLGPTKTIIGRRSMSALAIGPRSVTLSLSLCESVLSLI